MPIYTNTRPSIVMVAFKSVHPGAQVEITDRAHLEALEKKGPDGALTHPLRKGRNPILRQGVIEMPAPREIVMPSALDELDLTKALAQVRLCTDLSRLGAWATADGRPEIKEAITKRAAELTAQK